MVANYPLRRLLGFWKLTFIEQEAKLRERIKCLTREQGVIAVLCGAAISLFVSISLVFLQRSWHTALVGALLTFVVIQYVYILWGEIGAIRDANDRRKWSSFCYLKAAARIEGLGSGTSTPHEKSAS